MEDENNLVESKGRILDYCQDCHKPFYSEEEIYHYQTSQRVRNGRASHTETVDHVVCKDCYDRHCEQVEIERKVAAAERSASFRKKRIKSFVWGGLAAALFIVLGIVVNPILLAVAVFCFTFIGCLFFDNNFIGDMWLTVASWGFVRMPGVIFEFSLDGFIFLIVIKIILWLLGFLIAAAAFLLATLLGFALSIFVYPFALARNIKNKE